MDALNEVVLPAVSFKTVADNTLKQLNNEYPFGLWAFHPVGRPKDEIIILCSEMFERMVNTTFKQNNITAWLESLSDKFASIKKPHVINHKDKIIAPVFLIEEPIQSLIAIPVNNNDGELFAILYGLDTEVKSFDEDETELKLKYISEMLMIIYWQEQEIMRLKSLYIETEKLAHTDSLTHLFNLRGWEKQIVMENARCQRYKIDYAIVILDMDDLKKINDKQGHEKGDEELKKLAHFLEGSIREHDIAARLGGDEFGLFLYQSNRQQTNKTIKRIQNELVEHDINVSVGVSQSMTGRSIKDMVRLADKRLYVAKEDKHLRNEAR